VNSLAAVAEQQKSDARSSVPVQVIEPPRGWININWRELWQYRELFGFFVWRDVKVRYKQTLLGITWAVIGPLAHALIFTLIFTGLAKLPTDGLPGPVFYMAGLTVWRYFAQSLTKTSTSLVMSTNVLTKIYFPRLIIPVATLVTGLVDLAVGLLMVVLIMLYFNTLPAATSVFLPLLVLIAFGTAMGVGLFFTALNVKYRDVGQLVPFITQLWMYFSVVVPVSRIPETITLWGWKISFVHTLYGLNPMAGVVEGFRWCLMHHQMFTEKVVNGQTVQVPVEPPLNLLAAGVPVMIVLVLFGLYYFKRVERTFADII
jgi:lipopolysaccharide transport system permease protein